MRTTYILFLSCLTLIANVCWGATKTVTFQDLTGKAYTNLVVVALEKDGVLFRYGEESRYVRVKFTNLTEAVQLQCGYDAIKVEQQRKEKAEKERLAREGQIAGIKKRQADEIASLAFLITPLTAEDFPKTESAKVTCKELLAELKGVNTGLELGMSYNKFSELLTDTAIKIQKMRDTAKDEIPPAFQVRMDACIKIYNLSRDEWRRSIETESDVVKERRNYFRQQAWSKSGILLTMLSAVFDGRTNTSDSVIDEAVTLVEAEKTAFANGFLPGDLRSYVTISYLSEEELKKRLKEKLAEESSEAKR